MKTTKSPFRPLAAALALSIAALSITVFGQTTATTTPVGFMTFPLNQGQTTAVGFPLMETANYSGPVLSFTTNTIQASGVTWTANQFAAPGNPYFVAIKSGLQTGRTLLVTGNTTDTLTVQVDDTGLDAAGFSLVAGATPDTFDLFPGDTIGTVFGTTATAGVLPSGIQGGTIAGLADSVQIHNGAKFVTYFFNTTVGNWVVLNGGTADQQNTVLYPDRGLMIGRRGPNSTLTLMGRVPATGLLTKLPNGSTNSVAVRFPTDATLNSLNFSGPGTWTQNNIAGLADSVGIWNGAKWVSYYKNASGVWNQLNGGTTDQGATVVPAGSAVLILKRGSNNPGPSTFFSQALPYSL